MTLCCKYNAGMLRTVVQFQRLVRTSDGAGGFTQTWQAIPNAPTRAMVQSMSGTERFASARVEATATHKVTIRYFAGLTEADAVMIRGKRANIRFINNIEERDLWMVLDVQTGVVG
jgi:SPP1 family predicted phage head-tail adaptor